MENGAVGFTLNYGGKLLQGLDKTNQRLLDCAHLDLSGFDSFIYSYMCLVKSFTLSLKRIEFSILSNIFFTGFTFTALLRCDV